MSCRVFILVITIGFAWLQPIVYSQGQTKQSSSDYVEIFLGNEKTPLFALGQEVLSSDDVHACSLTNINQMNIFQPSVFHQTENQSTAQPRQKLKNLLLGFPLKALNKLMAMGAFLTDFSDNNNLHFQTPFFRNIIGRYRLSTFPAVEIRPKVIASNDGGCLLTFISCPERLRCSQNSIFQASVLGISAKHNALIIDPNEFGIHLKDDIHSIKIFSPSNLSLKMRLNLKDHRTYLIDFDESILIFDVIATSRWQGPDPRPKVTTRWFLKFDLVESEENFQSRPPTEGIGYLSNISRYQQERSIIPMRILRQRIFKDGKIKPIRYYVKNFPSRFQEGVRRGFEYWRSLFISLLGHPVLSYYFIQGDFDGQQEIIAGDIRFNVIPEFDT